MQLRTANHKAKRAMRRRVYQEGFAFHERRSMRLLRSGCLDKLKDSGFIRRLRKKAQF